MKVNQQKSNDQFWKDEAGMSIPYSRVSPYERKVERVLAKKAKDAIKLHESLAAYKLSLQQDAIELYSLFLEENNGKAGKGNATFFNFDRSVKYEVSVHDLISFDENFIGLAKAELDEFLSEGMEGAQDYIKPIVMDAFTMSNGKLDTKRVIGLKRYASRVNKPRYYKAMDLIDKAIRRASTREYYRISVKQSNGEYKSIDLNFSSI